ncbi:MAG: restriction endonuclease subunit S [Steroidobacteraceae bacterium]
MARLLDAPARRSAAALGTTGKTAPLQVALPTRNSIEPFIQTGDIKNSNGRITAYQQTYSEAGLAQSRLWPAGTMCITIAANIAETGILVFPACFPDSVVGFIAKDAKCDVRFVEYTFRHLRQHIQHEASGSVQNNINLETLDRLRFPFPPLAEQRAIAHILGALDDKIELNRRMSETLEAMARSLFKSWFVDFDPVRAKEEGRDPELPKEVADLFPSRFVESEIGEIPEGWGVGTLADVIEPLRDNGNPLDYSDVLFRHFSIPAFDNGQWPALERGEAIKSQKSRVPPGAVLMSKLNPEIERVWLVDVQPRDRAVCSTEFLVLRPRSPYGRAYAYCLGRSSALRQQLQGLVTGTSKSHQRAQVGSILTLATVMGPKPLIAQFQKAAEPLLARTLECRRESHTLAALRDALLPKLISGELRVRAAKDLQQAAV